MCFIIVFIISVFITCYYVFVICYDCVLLEGSMCFIIVFIICYDVFTGGGGSEFLPGFCSGGKLAGQTLYIHILYYTTNIYIYIYIYI